MDDNIVLDYFDGMNAYYQWLSNSYGQKTANASLIRNTDYIKYAQVALIATFFMDNKEDVVKKEKDLIFSSKVIDERLAESIEMVATKFNDEYIIDNYSIEKPAKFIADIRNSFAHGNYKIDTTGDGKVIFKNDGHEYAISLTKLTTLICKTQMNLFATPKTKKIKRIQVENNKVNQLGIDKITNENEIKTVLKSSRIVEYSFLSTNDENIPLEALESFYELNKTIKSLKTDWQNIGPLIEQIKKFTISKNVLFNVEEKIIDKSKIKKIIELICYDKEFYNNEYSHQIKILQKFMQVIVEPDYQKEGFLIGNTMNLLLLDKMKKTKNYNIESLNELVFTNEQSMISMSSLEIVASALISNFVSLYCYPFDKQYASKTSPLNKIDKLDFSSLDLSFLAPSKYTIYDKPLTESFERNKTSIKELYKLEKLIDETETNLQRVQEKGNIKAIETMTKQLSKLKNEEETVLNKALEYSLEYAEINEYYRENSNHYKNRAIIEGIRNSIAHGNVKVKPFENIGSFDDTIVNFQDIYNDEKTFELNVRIRDFEQLFSPRNTQVIAKFFEAKKVLPQPCESEIVLPQENVDLKPVNPIVKILKPFGFTVNNFIKSYNNSNKKNKSS